MYGTRRSASRWKWVRHEWNGERGLAIFACEVEDTDDADIPREGWVIAQLLADGCFALGRGAPALLSHPAPRTGGILCECHGVGAGVQHERFDRRDKQPESSAAVPRVAGDFPYAVTFEQTRGEQDFHGRKAERTRERVDDLDRIKTMPLEVLDLHVNTLGRIVERVRIRVDDLDRIKTKPLEVAKVADRTSDRQPRLWKHAGEAKHLCEFLAGCGGLVLLALDQLREPPDTGVVGRNPKTLEPVAVEITRQYEGYTYHRINVVNNHYSGQMRRKRRGGTGSPAGTSQPAVSEIESGKRDPGIERLRRLVNACGLDLTVELRGQSGHGRLVRPLPSRHRAHDRVERDVATLTREERRSLALYDAVANRLVDEPEKALQRARKNLSQLAEHAPRHSQRWVNEWRVVLDTRTVNEIERLLRSTSSYASDMRQTAPFAGLLSDNERRAALAAAK